MGVQPKRSSRLFIILGVALTALSMIGVYVIAQSSGKSASTGTVQVLVAKQEIPVHTIFTTPADVTTWLQPVAFPKTSVPTDSFASAALFESTLLNGTKQVTGETIYPNEPILASMFANIGNTRTGYTTAFELKKGDVAVSFQVQSVDESAGAVAAGDGIDIICSYMDGQGSGAHELGPTHPTQTQYVFQNLKVLGLGQLTPGAPVGSQAASTSSAAASTSSGAAMITVAVPPQQALLLQHMKDFPGDWQMSVVLRSAYGKKPVSSTPVREDWLFTKLRTNFVH